MQSTLLTVAVVLLCSFVGIEAENVTACNSRLSAVQEALQGFNRVSENDVCTDCLGKPGKRGAAGPPGSIGISGPKGEIGACNCSEFGVKELMEQVRALEDFQQKVSEFKDICNAGISTGTIPINHVSATSTHPSCSFSDISLGTSGAWCAEKNDANQYVQVDLQRPTYVFGILTRGRYGADQWVRSFQISYGLKSARRLPFYRVKGSLKTFKANVDTGTIKKNKFAEPIQARFIRVHPVRYKGHMSMSLELLLC